MSDNIVYKYRVWTNSLHRDILYHNELYLSSPKKFNDPFDCRIATDLALLDSDEKKERFIDNTIQNVKGSSFFPPLDFTTTKEQSLLKLKTDFTAEIERYKKLFFEMQDKCYGIVSLTFRWDSILMWSHYADLHQGFCVGFNRLKLDNSQFFTKGGPVRYSDGFPSIDPLEGLSVKQSFIETHTKAKDWEYEEEYRLTLTRAQGISEKDRKIKIDDNCFSEIIIGLKFPEDDLEKVKQIAKQKKIKLFKVVKIEGRFELSKEEIQLE